MILFYTLQKRNPSGTKIVMKAGKFCKATKLNKI